MKLERLQRPDQAKPCNGKKFGFDSDCNGKYLRIFNRARTSSKIVLTVLSVYWREARVKGSVFSNVSKATNILQGYPSRANQDIRSPYSKMIYKHHIKLI